MKKKDLERALMLALPGTEKSGFLGGLDQVLFDGEWLRSFNEQLSVSYPFKTDMEIAVRAEEFYKILTKMSGEEIDLKIDESKLVVSNQSTKLTMKTLPVGEYKRLKDSILTLNVGQWSPIPKGFKEGIPLSTMSGLRESRMSKLSGVVFIGKNIVSTDNFKVGYYQMESGISDEPFRLKLGLVENMVRLGKEFESVSINNQWLSFKSKNGMLVHVKMTDDAKDYPIAKVFGVFDDKSGIVHELPIGLEESLDRVEILAHLEDEDFKTLIKFKTEDGNLVVSSSRDFAQIEDRIPWDVTDIEFYATPGWLKRILQVTRKFRVNQKGLMVFEAPNFQFLMMTKKSL